MRAAIIKDNTVVNMISILPANLKEFPNAIDPEPWGLMIGDYTTDGGQTWYRGGEVLPIVNDEADEADYIAALDKLGVNADEEG